MVVHNFPVGVSSQLLELAADRLFVGPPPTQCFRFVSWQDWAWQQDERLWSWQCERERLSLEEDRFLAGPPPPQCFLLVSWQGLPGRLREWQRGGGMQMLCLEALSCCCSLSFLAFSFCSGKQALWTAAMFQCPFCPSQSVLVKLCCHGRSAYQKATYHLLPFHWQPLLVGVGGGPGGTMTRRDHKHKMTGVTLFCETGQKKAKNRSETGQKKVRNRSFTSHLEMLLQDLMPWVNGDDSWELWYGAHPPTLQEWEEEGRKPNWASNVSPHTFLSLGWQSQGASLHVSHMAVRLCHLPLGL